MKIEFISVIFFVNFVNENKKLENLFVCYILGNYLNNFGFIINILVYLFICVR